MISNKYVNAAFLISTMSLLQSIALVQRKLILLTFRRNKWSDVGRTPTDIMHIV